MAVGRDYDVDSGLVTFTGTTATPVLYGAATSTSTADIKAFRIGSYAAASASYPVNGSILLQIFRVTGTVAGGTTVTAVPDNSLDIAANTTWKDATGSALTGLTPGVCIFQRIIPFTAGSDWSEWVTPGAEKRIPASGLIAAYLTTAVGGTNTQFSVGLSFVE